MIQLQRSSSPNSRPVFFILLTFICATPYFGLATAIAGEQIYVSVRWCGIEGAPSMVDPGQIGEPSTDALLWRRHERPTDRIYQDPVQLTFRSGATASIRDSVSSFPIIRDPRPTGQIGNITDGVGSDESDEAVNECRLAWTMGDAIYFDQNNNGTVNSSTDARLGPIDATVGSVGLGHEGDALTALPSSVKHRDSNGDGVFQLSERLYRDEDNDGLVSAGDILLVQTMGPAPGVIEPADIGLTLSSAPSQLKFLDLIRQPANTYSVGYPNVIGLTAISAYDFEHAGIEFPVHGIATTALGAVMDDPTQYLPPGPNYFDFETQLVGHEFGHLLGLPHGDGLDDDGDGIIDNENTTLDPTTTAIPGAGPGTLCDADNTMQYCWDDNGTSGVPNLTWIGVGTPSPGTFTPGQATRMRTRALTIADSYIDPVPQPLTAARVDPLGDAQPGFDHLDINDFSLGIDDRRENVLFELTTRDPFPDRINRTTRVYFVLDLDSNRETGAKPSTIGVPSEIEGAEFVGRLIIEGRQIRAAEGFLYNASSNGLKQIDSNRWKGILEAVESIIDMPRGLKATDPDAFDGAVPFRNPVAERIRLQVPLTDLALPEDISARVEYIVEDAEAGVIDRVQTPGLVFKRPVWPECKAEPSEVRKGGSSQIFASGLLPNIELHMFLGDTEIGVGMSDSEGNASLLLDVPPDARSGNRLVTVGARAVSADCPLIVTKDDGTNGGGMTPIDPSIFEKCCEVIRNQLWIMVVLLAITVLLLLMLVFRRR